MNVSARISVLAFLLLGAGVDAPSAGAQQEEGDVELQFTGSLLATAGQEDRSITAGILQAKMGYFLTDRVELGAFPSLTYFRIREWVGATEVTSSETRVGLGVFTTYSFLAEDAATVPYVGAQFYRIDVTDEDETGWLGVNGGIKYYMSRRTAFDLGGNALVGLGDDGGALLLLQVGLSFLL